MKEHEASEQLKVIKNKLHTYVGIKARYFEIKSELKEEYLKKVAPKDHAVIDELKTLVYQRDRYHAAYSRYESEEDPEYQAYINTLGEIVNT